MVFFISWVITIILIAALVRPRMSTVVQCLSFTCSYNRQGQCCKERISVYDNMVKGLCYDHTEDMRERILEPMARKGMTFKHLESSPTEFSGVCEGQIKRRANRKDRPTRWLN